MLRATLNAATVRRSCNGKTTAEQKVRKQLTHRGHERRSSCHTQKARSREPSQLPEALISRVRSEYMELPGLQLTPWQAQRLWALDREQCDAVLAALVEAAFLRRTQRGSYVRAAESY